MWTVEQSRNVIFKRHFKCKKKGHNLDSGKLSLQRCNRCHMTIDMIKENDMGKAQLELNEERVVQ